MGYVDKHCIAHWGKEDRGGDEREERIHVVGQNDEKRKFDQILKLWGSRAYPLRKLGRILAYDMV